MSKSPLVVAVLRSVCLTLVLAAAVACSGSPGFEVREIRTFDGDSFLARRADGGEVEIRLFGIDAPERQQPWSRRSREALRGMIRDRRLRVSEVTVDSYDRVVAIVTLPDGLEVNAAMVRDGHAWVYRRYTDDPRLLRLEASARQAERGLWSLPPAEQLPPWEWRRRQRSKSDARGAP